MKYIKQYTTVATTGIAVILSGVLSGCGQKPADEQMQPQAKGAFVVIEETAPGRYKVKDEFPADETRIILKKLDGTEKVLTREEMDALLAQEKAKIDAGQYLSQRGSDDSATRRYEPRRSYSRQCRRRHYRLVDRLEAF